MSNTNQQQTATPANPNLDAIWNKVQVTDPHFTRNVSGARDGRGMTTINAVYLIKKATALLGPIGSNWGYNIIDERIVDGAPAVEIHDGVPVTLFEKIHVLRIELWYKTQIDGKLVEGRYQQFGQTTMVRRVGKLWVSDEDAPKKSLTDALTKGLSWLGFAADVHMGLYDDVKYVNGLKAAGETKEANVAETPAPGKDEAPKADEAKAAPAKDAAPAETKAKADKKAETKADAGKDQAEAAPKKEDKYPFLKEGKVVWSAEKLAATKKSLAEEASAGNLETRMKSIVNAPITKAQKEELWIAASARLEELKNPTPQREDNAVL